MSILARLSVSCLLVTSLTFAQSSDEEIQRRIEGLISLVRAASFDQAIKDVNDLVNTNPGSFAAHMASFRVHFSAFQNQPGDAGGSDNLEEALKRLDFARRLNPLDYEAWELSLSFWSPSRVNQPPPGQETEQLLMEAGDFMEAGQAGQAAENLKKVIALEPDYTPAYLHLGEIYLAQGDYPEALRLADTVSAKNPRDPDSFFLAARAYALLERGQESLDSLIRSLRADPGFPPAWGMLTRLDLGGNHVEHMAVHFPKEVLWLVDREVDEPTLEDLEPLNAFARPAWKDYISARVRWRKVTFQRQNPEFKVYRYTFREEITAVTDMLGIWAEIKASQPEAKDPLLDHWLDASRAGALEVAIFLDLYLEEFRQDFTGWKQENGTKFEEYFHKYLLPKFSQPMIETAG